MYKTKDFDFKPRGAFFAFSDKQFNATKVEGIEYVSLGRQFAGLIAPKDKAVELVKAMVQHYKQEQQTRLETDGIDKIIAYELSNHECYYTGSIEDVLHLCDTYGITEEKIREVFHKEKVHQEDYF